MAHIVWVILYDSNALSDIFIWKATKEHWVTLSYHKVGFLFNRQLNEGLFATAYQRSGNNLKPEKAGATNPCRFGSFTFNMQVCTYLGGKTKMSHILWLISYDSHFIIDDWCSTLETFWNFKQNASPRAKKILNELIDRDPLTTRLGPPVTGHPFILVNVW